MRDEFSNPVRSVVGGWNAYDLWRTTIDVPRKVQLVATRDDDDEDPHYTRRKVGKAVRKVIGAILLLLLLTTALALGNPNARSPRASLNGTTAAEHSDKNIVITFTGVSK